MPREGRGMRRIGGDNRRGVKEMRQGLDDERKDKCETEKKKTRESERKKRCMKGRADITRSRQRCS